MLDIHQLPGRLRVRSALIQGDPRFAETVRARLSQLKGVTATRTNVRTGSVIVEYNPSQTHLAPIWRELRSLKIAIGVFGFPQDFPPELRAVNKLGAAPTPLNPLVKECLLLFGKSLLALLVQHSAQRTALLLLRRCF